MIIDRYSGHHSTCDHQAVSHFEDAVRCFALHRPISDALDNALSVDPTMIAASALRGFAHVLEARRSSMHQASISATQAKEQLKRKYGGSSSERALTEALTAAAAGRLKEAASRLEAELERSPHNFLAVKLSHAMRFMTGDAERMLATMSSIVPRWSSGDPGYGFVLGCHAFSLEERGNYAEAEVAGRRAVSIESADVWGLHAVAHVMEMSGRVPEGIGWLEASRAIWQNGASFSLHLAWHLALFRLALGDEAGAVDLYDSDIQPSPDGDFRDMINAVSMLWRLEQEGIDVGDRWHHLSSIASSRRDDATYALAALHNLIALVSAGDLLSSQSLVDAMHEKAGEAGCDQARVYAEVALPFASLVAPVATDDSIGQARLERLASCLQMLGGSNAQRDVFLRELLLQAGRLGDRKALTHLSDLRLRQHAYDRFHARLERRLMRQSMWAAPMHVG